MTVLFIAILLVLALIGSPLFVILGTATTLCFAFFLPDAHGLQGLLPVMQNMEGLVTRQEFLAIPLFMASGAIMTAGGIAKRLVDIARAALGWMPGGIGIASVAACMFFAAISGSSPVTLIAVGSIMFPAMVQSKYPENMALGLVTTAGSLGCLVPPSISMLIYSISTTATSASVTPDDLFLAGLIPAGFIALLLAAYSFFKGLFIPGSREPFSFSKLRIAVREGFWALLLPIIVLGGIYGGMYTPSEAGAVATVYSLAITLLVYRELKPRTLAACLMEGATLMGSLILIILLAFGLNDFLALIEIQEKLMALLRWMNLGPVGFMLLVNAILIIIGALMDSISCTLIFAPMLAPVAYELYGIDPVHFGVVFVINMEIGYLMPPVATNLFVAAAVFRKSFGQVTRAVVPTLAITCLALVVVIYVPTISKAAVNWKRGKPGYQAFPWDGKPPAAAPTEVEAGVTAPPPDKQEGGSAMSKVRKLKIEGLDDEEEDEDKPAGADAGAQPVPPP